MPKIKDMLPDKWRKLIKKLPTLGVSELVAIGLVAFFVFVTFSFYSERIFPNTYINGVSVGGLTIEESIKRLSQAISPTPESEVVIGVDGFWVNTDTVELGLAYNFENASRKAFLVGKEGKLRDRFLTLLKSFTKTQEIEAKLEFQNKELATELLTDLKLMVDVIGEDPSAQLATSGQPQSLVINPGQPGRVLDIEASYKRLNKLANQGVFEAPAHVVSTSVQLDENEIEEAKQRAQKLVGKTMELTNSTQNRLPANHNLSAEVQRIDRGVRVNQNNQDTENQEVIFTLNDQALISLLAFSSGINQLVLDELVDNWADQIELPPQDAVFEKDENSQRVKVFKPHQYGWRLDKEKTRDRVESGLEFLLKHDQEQTTTQPLSIVTTKPQVTLAETNDLGIVELIGFGESLYHGSIANRVHNVTLTTNRISGAIVAPGEEFSFNQALGEVSSRTGFRPAYIIRGGRTELGDGGGVCQVSTTLFRTLLDSGLLITRRLPHSYRVSYYELDNQPGFDATVYSGNIDLRFINDTDHHILIYGQTNEANRHMYFEIYGTSDGRTTEIAEHTTWDHRPPLPPEYFPDPSLAPGEVRQVDWAAAGIKARFKHIVRDKDGHVMRDNEYYSNYKPWSAKFLVGE